MEVFFYGMRSVLSFDVAILTIVSFFLIGKLSSFFGSHFAKVIIFSVTTFVLFSSFTMLGPSLTYEIFTVVAYLILVQTLLVCLRCLGLHKAIKSEQPRNVVEGIINWTAPVVFGYWFFAFSFSSLMPYIMDFAGLSPFEPEINIDFELVPLFFASGLLFVSAGILTFSWFFHNKFKEMQFWKVLQAIAAVLVMIYSLRSLVMITFA